MSFPRCELHNTNVVFAFPEGCPLGFKDISKRQSVIKDQRYWDCKSDPYPANMLAAIDETCNACIPRIISHAHVQNLRRKGPLH